MLVLKSVVLFVQTDDVLQEHRFPLGISSPSIEVLNMAQAIASERQLICCYTEADVTNIKGLLTMEWLTGIYGDELAK